jgi:hypothetical protein
MHALHPADAEERLVQLAMGNMHPSGEGSPSAACVVPVFVGITELCRPQPPPGEMQTQV